MSKSMIESLVKTQFASLLAKDNKERLRFTVAGCKDGKLYDHIGTDYGTFNTDAPDTVFIPETDLALSRITGVKLQGINQKMVAFFDTYGSNPVAKEETTDTTDEDEDADEVTTEIDTDAVETACKKAIKKGNFKKAQKLIDALGGHKKLQKKLDKAQ